MDHRRVHRPETPMKYESIHRPAASRPGPRPDPGLVRLHARLRAIAQRCLVHERRGHTLQATALAHEAWLRLAHQRELDWNDEARIQALAAQMMRRILVDHARARRAAKRGGDRRRMGDDSLDGRRSDLRERVGPDCASAIDVLALEEALRKLAAIDPTLVRIVELRFFAGMSVDQTAALLDLAPRSVDRRWAAAQAWLYREIAEGGQR